MGISLSELGRAGTPVISKNGSYIAIGNEGKIDVFTSDITLRTSVPVVGARPYGNYAVAAISNDGGKVFARDWNGLFGSGGGLYEINASNGERKRLDVDSNGNTVTYQGWSIDAKDIDLSADNSTIAVALRDTADSITWGSQRTNIYVKNLSNGHLERIDYKTSTDEMGFSQSPRISGDGSKVIFTSDLSLTGESVSSAGNIYLWQRGSGFKLLNKDSSGRIFGSSYGWHADISGDGSKVVFQTDEALVAGDTNRTSDVYLKDLGTGEFTRISNDANNKGIYPTISQDGTKVFYQVLYEGSWPDRYLKYYDVTTRETIDVPGSPYTNSPNFRSESFESIASDAGIFWTYKDYAAGDTDGDADYYYFSLGSSSPAVSDSSYSISDAQGYEGDAINVTISRTGNIDLAHTLKLSWSNGTAFQGFDFIPPSASVRFESGEASKVVSVRTVEDALVEADETFYLSLTSNESTATIADDKATVTILNDDAVTAVINNVVNNYYNSNNTTTNINTWNTYKVDNSVKARDIVIQWFGNDTSIQQALSLSETKLLDIQASSWNDKVLIKSVGQAGDNGGRLEAPQIDDLTTGNQGSVLNGAGGKDQIQAKAGWDVIDGGANDDFIRAGNGRDIITGGFGADELWGDFGWNTYKSEKDGSRDLIAIKSDQNLVNWLYGKAGNNPNGEKADIIEGLDSNDVIKILGASTESLSFANASAHGLSGIGIYAGGALEALYTGGDLSIDQIRGMTSGDASAAAMNNSLSGYGVW